MRCYVPRFAAGLRPVDGEGLNKMGLVMASGLLCAITVASLRVASNYIPPLTLTTFRLMIACAVLCLILFFVKPKHHWSLRGIFDITVVSMLTVAIPFFFMASALHHISSSLATILSNLMAPFTVILAHFFVKNERLNGAKIFAAVVSVSGASILLLSNSSGLTSGGEQAWIGQLLIAGGSLSGALGVIHARNAFHQVNAFVLATAQVIVSTLVFVPVFLLTGNMVDILAYPAQAWIAVILAALGGPVAALSLLFYIINRYGASVGGFSGITTPLFSVLIGVLFLCEGITPHIAVGAVLLVIGGWTLNRF